METKKCRVCCEIKCVNDFPFRVKAKGTRHNICCECNKKAGKNRYKKNKQYYIDKSLLWKANTCNQNRIRVFDFLKNHPCVDCDEKDIVVLQFDHVRGKKCDNISTLISKASTWKTISEEIEKCEVRCANCHTRKTAKENNWMSIYQ